MLVGTKTADRNGKRRVRDSWGVFVRMRHKRLLTADRGPPKDVFVSVTRVRGEKERGPAKDVFVEREADCGRPTAELML